MLRFKWLARVYSGIYLPQKSFVLKIFLAYIKSISFSIFPLHNHSWDNFFKETCGFGANIFISLHGHCFLMPFKASSNDSSNSQLHSSNSVGLLLYSEKKLFWRTTQVPDRSVTNILYCSLFFIHSRWFFQIHHTCPKESWKIKFIKAKYILGSKPSWEETLHTLIFQPTLCNLYINNLSQPYFIFCS